MTVFVVIQYLLYQELLKVIYTEPELNNIKDVKFNPGKSDVCVFIALSAVTVATNKFSFSWRSDVNEIN